MKRLILLILLLSVAKVATAQKDAYYEQKVSLYDVMAVHSNDIVFLGDGHIERCSWAELFQNRHIKNRGIQGDCTQKLLGRIDTLIQSHPKKLFLQVGINDLMVGATPSEVAQRIDQLIKRFEQESPWTKIYVQSIFPINGVDTEPPHPEWIENRVIVNTNRMLKKLCEERKNVFYIDVFEVLVNDRGLLDSRYTNDGIHLLGNGYLKWQETIEKFVK